MGVSSNFLGISLGVLVSSNSSHNVSRHGGLSKLFALTARTCYCIQEKKRASYGAPAKTLGNAYGQTIDRYLRAAAKRRAGRSAGRAPHDPIHRSSAGLT